MLIFRPSPLTSYGKNIAKPHYKPKVKKFKKKILHVSQSSFSPCFLVLSIIVTFWSFHGEIVAEAYYRPQESQFARHCQTPHNNPS